MSLGRRRALIALVYFAVALICCGALSRVIAAVGVADVVVASPEPASVEGAPYLQCVPGAAVYRDGAMTYVYVVDERAGFLGAELCARRVNVGVENSDDWHVALREGTLADSQRVITRTSRAVDDGDTVRVVTSLGESEGLATTVEEAGVTAAAQVDKPVRPSSATKVVALLAPVAVAVCLVASAFLLRRKSQASRFYSAVLFHAAVLLLLLTLTAVLGQGVVLYGDLLPSRWSDFSAWRESWGLLVIDGGAALMADPVDLPGQSAAEQICSATWTAMAVVAVAGAFVAASEWQERKEERDGA